MLLGCNESEARLLDIQKRYHRHNRYERSQIERGQLRHCNPVSLPETSNTLIYMGIGLLGLSSVESIKRKKNYE